MVLLRILLLLCAAVFAAAVFLPLAPRMPRAGLDPSWEFAMNYAIATGMAIGQEVVFTFGPYAFVYADRYVPGLAALHFASGATLAIAFVAALATLAARSALPTVSCALGAAFAAFLTQLVFGDAICQSIPLLYLLVVLQRSPRGKADTAVLLLLAVAMAILTLTKGSFAISSVLVLGTGLVAALLRRAPLAGALPCIAFAIAVPALWVIAGQDLAGLPGFVRNAIEIIRGYSNAMSLAAPAWQPALYCAIAVAVLALNLRQFRQGLAGTALFLGAAALMFLAFKAGFVRHDTHAVMAAGVLATSALGLVVAAPARKAHWLALALGLTGWAAIAGAWIPLSAGIAFARAQDAVRHGVVATIERIRQPEALAARYAETLAAIRARYPLPPVLGSADIYSFDQARLLAHGMEWSPRPVFQSYSAYTPRLVEMNAAHLRGSRAPGTVFFAVQPIDERLAALDDGPSWLPLLSLYRFVGQRDGVAVLERRPPGTERAITASPVETVRHALGERVALPAGLVWASVDIRPTLLGQLVSILHRAPMLQISLHMRDGSVEQRRFIPGAASAGFLISPYIRSTTDFAGLNLGADHFAAHQQPVAFSIEGRALARFADRFWSSPFEVGLRTLAMAAEPEAGGLLGTRPELVEGGVGEPVRRQSCNLETVDGRQLQGQAAVTAGRFMDVGGWAFMQGPPRRAADRMALLLASPAGTVLRFPLLSLDRPDVAQAFRQADLLRSGFQGSLNLSGHAGQHVPFLEMAGPHGREVCQLRDAPIIVTSD